jgi:flagellar P-ring protein precursor FlgI
VGGYQFDAHGNQRQKNHPTVGTLLAGGTVETPLRADYRVEDGKLRFVIRQPDATTAQRIAERINESHGAATAVPLGPEAVSIQVPRDASALTDWVASIERLAVVPDAIARVVLNPRTGTIAAGGDLRVAPVTVTHGDLQVAVNTEFSATAPTTIGVIAINGATPVVLANSTLAVEEGGVEVAHTFNGTTVAELVRTLTQARVGTRDIIAILQAVQAAGALHAQIVTQ